MVNVRVKREKKNLKKKGEKEGGRQVAIVLIIQTEWKNLKSKLLYNGFRKLIHVNTPYEKNKNKNHLSKLNDGLTKLIHIYCDYNLYNRVRKLISWIIQLSVLKRTDTVRWYSLKESKYNYYILSFINNNLYFLLLFFGKLINDIDKGIVWHVARSNTPGRNLC